MSKPGTISHDVAAQLLDLPPAELADLVSRGVIPRVDRNAYVIVAIVRAYVAHLRAERDHAENSPRQAEIATHLDVSERRVRELLVEWGIDHRVASLSEIRVRYIRKLREEAAGRAAAGDLDLAAERARLASEQADKIQMQNAVTRRELSPTYLLEAILGRAAARACPLLDTIPGELRRRVPGLDSVAMAKIESIIAKARNTIAAITLDQLEEDSPDTTPDDPDPGESDDDERSAA